MRIYSAAEVHAALPWAALVEQLSRAFAQGAEVPVRHAHALGGSDTLLLMPAWSASAIGVKLVTVMPGNSHKGKGTVQASYLLLERDSGEALAMLDGEALTLRRTAAASALAACHLAREDARHLLVVGSGRLAAWMARAHMATRPGIEHLRIWGRNPQAMAALVQELRAEGLPADAAPDLETAVRGSDIVCCATTATTPLVRGAWLADGCHVDLVGAFKADMREVDDETIVRARVCVDTYAGALAEAGDIVQPLRAGLIARSHVVAELAELVRGDVPGRRKPSEITVFKSVGTALEDLAAAQLVLQAGTPTG